MAVRGNRSKACFGRGENQSPRDGGKILYPSLPDSTVQRAPSVDRPAKKNVSGANFPSPLMIALDNLILVQGKPVSQGTQGSAVEMGISL